MKKGKRITININFSNRLTYTLIAVGILLIIGVGVYATTYAPSGAGHPYTEISTCSANQTLMMNSAGTAWTCATGGSGTETDPTVPYKFGGMYTRGSGSCKYANPYTGGCSCPSGYSSQTIFSGSYDKYSIYSCYK